MRLVAVALLAVGLAACGSEPAVSASVAASPPVTEFTVVASGDFISQPELSEQATAEGGFAKILGALKPMVSTADLAICHLETPLAAPGDPWTGYPTFNAPPSLVDTAADLGYDTCSTASNHTLDYGWEGLVRTLDGLDRVGLKHAGSARTAAEAATPTLVSARGIKVGHLSYTFSFNGLPLPEDKPWSANLIDAAAIQAQARRAREAGAEVVVLSLHWGTEYQHEADDGQLGLARELLASPDIDLIVGTHVHVVQPMEKIGTKWVAYGMGNVMVRFPDGSPEDTQDAHLTRYTFTKSGGRWAVSKVEALPTWMEYQPASRVVDLPTELARSGLSETQRDTYRRAYDRIAGWLTSRGADQSGLILIGHS
ncbi:poly-gamma-glutamate biosynthesis protein [Rhizocola hellebori]|uniref:Poly-gamma-glutamate biosynthesis protein n=1 Tax=Rhizocola hellebori TaxID=1392758 RepID=A0A8J3VJY4_9ACTN|nr:CapA family protein [Rhizocola hellebori]GIH09879.1 poly-gamma-glutamate biosynthesis protein [Rhizocola hellebori]